MKAAADHERVEMTASGRDVSPVRRTGRKSFVRNRTPKVQTIRFYVQTAFALLCVWIGVEFYYFVRYLDSGGVAQFVARPPGVDGFLPISSLMSLYYLLLSGTVHPYHPAGLFILSAIMLMSLIVGKSFCSWLCPVGFISETLGDLGRRLFGQALRMPRWLDYPLRSLKYLLLAFFVYSIFFLMGEAALKQFLDSPYNLVADIKMYFFFADISRVSLIVIGSLILLSVFIRNFWCRYLCPYGAFLGIASLLSVFRIKRNPVSCIDCGKCARVCPSAIKVDKVGTVVSDECTGCMDCLDACPVANTLELRMAGSRRRITPRMAALIVVAVFMAVTGTGMLTGYWDNGIDRDTYLQHQSSVHMYGHPTSTSDVNRLNEQAEADPGLEPEGGYRGDEPDQQKETEGSRGETTERQGKARGYRVSEPK